MCEPKEAVTARRKQKEELAAEYVYNVRPLLDILLEWYWMKNLVPKNVPQDLIGRLSARESEPFSLRIHPCSVVYGTVPNVEPPWPCGFESGTSYVACPSLRNSGVPGFCCSGCGFYFCKDCAQPHLRRSARRAPRTATHQLTVGAFSSYPSILDVAMPSVFSVPLLEIAPTVLSFLAAAEELKVLSTADSASYVAYVRYYHWISILRDPKYKNVVLVPPLDAVWFTHMLQSLVYQRFAEPLGFLDRPHTWTLQLSPQERKQAQKRCEEIWTIVSGKAKLPYEYPKTLQPRTWASGKRSDIDRRHFVTETDVMLDREWYREFKKATKGLNVSSPTFFQRSLLGYQKFLYLLAKYPMTLRRIAFAPSPPIDLFWHTHLVMPAAYSNDLTKLLYNVHHHHVLHDASKRTLQTYDANSEEEKLWSQEFHESYSVYISPLPLK